MSSLVVRFFEERDVPEVAEYHRLGLGVAADPTPALSASYREFFRTVFLRNPWRSDTIASLVSEEDGRVTGFLGVVPRPLRFDGRPVLAAVSSILVVRPGSHGIVPVRLLKAFLSGPQDLSLADEATDVVEHIWNRLGGRTSYCHSTRWMSVLRPARLAVNALSKRVPVLRAISPLARLADAVFTRVPRSPFRRPSRTSLRGRLVDVPELNQLLASSKERLAPVHTPETLGWLLDRIGSSREIHGTLRTMVVETPQGKPAGHYVYHQKTTGVSRVLLFSAEPKTQDDVLAHLFEDAWSLGSAALGGLLPPRFQHAFARAQCMLDADPRWFLVHAKSRELLEAVCSGDDALSQLDGEWIAHFNHLGSNAEPVFGFAEPSAKAGG